MRWLTRRYNRLGKECGFIENSKPWFNENSPTQFHPTPIFDHVQQVHTRTAGSPVTLRITLDTKVKVKIVAFSRGGVARGQESLPAADHDMHPDALLAPAGSLVVDRDPGINFSACVDSENPRDPARQHTGRPDTASSSTL